MKVMRITFFVWIAVMSSLALALVHPFGDAHLRAPVGVAKLGVLAAQRGRRARRVEGVRDGVEGKVQLGKDLGL